MARALLDGTERIGTVLRTRDRVKPVFVSPGHLIDHDSAVRWVLTVGGGYRLPEPTRLADRLLTDFGYRGRLRSSAQPSAGSAGRFSVAK